MMKLSGGGVKGGLSIADVQEQQHKQFVFEFSPVDFRRQATTVEIVFVD